MQMGSSSSMSMSMDMASSTASASMSMGHGSMSMSMPMSSSTSDSMSGMSGMDDMEMSMNTFLTTEYSGYPVIFKTLKASTGGAAFGIFCILFFTAFATRGLTFLGAYLQQRVFTPPKKFDLSENERHGHNHNHAGTVNTSGSLNKHDDINESSNTLDVESDTKSKHSLKNRSVLAQFLAVTPTSLYRDFIRLIVAFLSAMFGYALMLAAMTFIIPYFFAIILGLAFGEVFFFRLSSIMGINQAESFCESLH